MSPLMDAQGAWRDYLAVQPDTKAVDLYMPDLTGIVRGKRVTASAFASGLDDGFPFASSLYSLDTTGANVESTGLVWEEGDPDRLFRPDMASLRPVPWLDGTAEVLGGLVEDDGQPFFPDPRAALVRVIGRFAELGLTPCVALEYEFYLIQATVGPDGAPLPPLDPTTGRPQTETHVFSLDGLEEHRAFLEALENYARAQRLPLKGAVAEYAPGQYEVNLGHVADPLQAADHGFVFKRAVKAAARSAGLAASFMAKPFPDQSGNGLHLHVSLLDAQGRNLFGRDEGEARLRHAIGGLRATMAEAMLVFAPNANSYRRFRNRSYVPMAPTWGYNNRTVALRIPRGPRDALRVEHRVAGADANPYLVLAAVLAGMHHGLTGRLDPGAPITGNAYDQIPASLPVAWDRAIAAHEAAPILPGYLGERLWTVYGQCRAGERDRFMDVIHPVEHAWYLGAV
ncbi:glutamine synthetase family protein [Marinivivus vitaminiproducens]|uniref:glutamine synthetase family protein n=1 Tax=Marinivivus vitaminiproducens TaxID=3035935 RepID=UPI0027A76C77|nr:glutamine synthetase family protein [Geminicoccaceae bacterium SCSIO 64248]